MSCRTLNILTLAGPRVQSFMGGAFAQGQSLSSLFSCFFSADWREDDSGSLPQIAALFATVGALIIRIGFLAGSYMYTYKETMRECYE